MSANPRRRRLRRWTVWMSATLFLMLSVLSIAQPSSALAFVNGKVWDSVGNPLEGANITVNIWNPDETQINATLYDDATDEDGFYTVLFGGFPTNYEPKVNDVIEVIAKYLSEPPVPNKTVVTQICPAYTVNVTIGSIVIPEFGIGTSIGLPLAILGVVAIFAVIGRRRAN